MVKNKKKGNGMVLEGKGNEAVVSEAVETEEKGIAVNEVVETENKDIAGEGTVMEEEKAPEMDKVQEVEGVTENPTVSEMGKKDTESKDNTITEEVTTETATEEKKLTFRSDSEEARYYILQLLLDNNNYKKQDIVAYVTEKSGRTFSDACMINVLRNLVNTGSLMQLERGSYKLGRGLGLASKLIAFIDSTRKGLDKITTVSISEISESDLKVIQDIKELKFMLDDMFEKLGTK